MTVHWENLSPLINETVLYYIANAHHGNLSRATVVSGDLYSANVLGLSAYTEYQVNIIGINSNGQPYGSSNATALTEEGGKFSMYFILFHKVFAWRRAKPGSRPARSVQLDSPETALTAGVWIRSGGQNWWGREGPVLTQPLQ